MVAHQPLFSTPEAHGLGWMHVQSPRPCMKLQTSSTSVVSKESQSIWTCCFLGFFFFNILCILQYKLMHSSQRYQPSTINHRPQNWISVYPYWAMGQSPSKSTKQNDSLGLLSYNNRSFLAVVEYLCINLMQLYCENKFLGHQRTLCPELPLCAVQLHSPCKGCLSKLHCYRSIIRLTTSI